MAEDEDEPGYLSEEVRALFARLVTELERRGGDALHLEPGVERYRVRLRIGGALHESEVAPTLAPGTGQALAGRMKLVATIRPEPLPIPVDGEVNLADGRRFDVESLPLGPGGRPQRRVEDRPGLAPARPGAARPARAGLEGVVLKVTHPRAGSTPTSLEALVAASDARRALGAALDLGQGLVLVVGPRGSGKRTLLRACLARQAAAGLHAADVGSYRERARDSLGVTTPVPQPAHGYDRLAALRRALDLGARVAGLTDALRDRAEGEQVVDAALRPGVQLLASLWGRDAVDGALRLGEVGVDPERVAHALRLVVAVRLVHRLCPECKAPSPRPTLAELRRLAPTLPDEVASGRRRLALFEPRGCPGCRGTGRAGRLLVAEALPLERPSPLLERGSLRERLEARRGPSLREAAVALALEGAVALEDALEAT